MWAEQLSRRNKTVAPRSRDWRRELSTTVEREHKRAARLGRRGDPVHPLSEGWCIGRPYHSADTAGSDAAVLES
jgi:hypothetical protein